MAGQSSAGKVVFVLVLQSCNAGLIEIQKDQTTVSYFIDVSI